jgi:hypothetical protein
VLRRWRELNVGERQDRDLLMRLLGEYDDKRLQSSEHRNKLLTEVTNMDRDGAEAAEKIKREREKQDSNMNKFQLLISKYDMYYLSNEGKYLLTTTKSTNKGIEVQRVLVAPTGLAAHTGLEFNDEGITALNNSLRSVSRMKIATVQSFREQNNDDILNLISTKGWLLPTPGDVHPIFDILMDSLSDGKKENREHIEKCLVYKYLHPECYRIPTQTISGRGGIGKNEFADGPLSCIFGVEQVVTLGSQEVFGTYNGQMIGRTVIYVDEAITDKVNVEKLKGYAGNPSISVNEKFGLQGVYDNTVWYWLGGNGTNGNILMSGDTTDRRYSVMTANRSLFYWVSVYLGLSSEKIPGIGEVIKDVNHPASVWWNAHSGKLKDKSEVAKWLYKLIETYGDLDQVPMALHSVDYNEILEVQENTFARTMEYVFDDPSFDHIEASDLYQVYGLIHQKSFIGNNGKAFSRGRFDGEVKSWLSKHHPDIQESKAAKIRISGNHQKGSSHAVARQTSANVYAMAKNSDKKHYYFNRNTVKYLEKTKDSGDVFLVERYENTDPVADELVLGLVS